MMEGITLFKETENGKEEVLTIKKDKEFYKYLFDEYFKEYKDKNLILLKSFCISVGFPYGKYDKQVLKHLKERDGNVIYFEISQHKTFEKPYGKFSYTWILVDKDDNVLIDESDGEMKIGQVYWRLYEVMGWKHNSLMLEDLEEMCYADELDIDCLECGHCEE